MAQVTPPPPRAGALPGAPSGAPLWAEFDDGYVVAREPRFARTSAAYVLFYKRAGRGGPPLPPPIEIRPSDAADAWGRPVRGWWVGGGRLGGGGGGHGVQPAWHGDAQRARAARRRALRPHAPRLRGGGAPFGRHVCR